MRITINPVFDIRTGKLIRHAGQYEHRGPADLCKASSAQNTLATDQANFYQTLTQNYHQQFAGQTAILQSLQNAYAPILAAGPGQQGFTPTQLTAMNTSATENNAQQFQNAKIAIQNNTATAGGGDQYLPSGAAAQLGAAVNTASATNEENALNTITQQNYAQGLQNFNNAAQVLGGVSSQMNPLGYAGASTSAGKEAFGEATTIQQENTAWEGELGGILGGAAGAALGNPSLHL
jgi:hypothetical protein